MDDDRDVNTERSHAQQAIFGLLTEMIRRDTYPSSTMMDIVESHMTDEQLPDYLAMLIDKIGEDPFPSMDMIRRVLALT